MEEYFESIIVLFSISRYLILWKWLLWRCGRNFPRTSHLLVDTPLLKCRFKNTWNKSLSLHLRISVTVYHKNLPNSDRYSPLIHKYNFIACCISGILSVDLSQRLKAARRERCVLTSQTTCHCYSSAEETTINQPVIGVHPCCKSVLENRHLADTQEARVVSTAASSCLLVAYFVILTPLFPEQRGMGEWSAPTPLRRRLRRFLVLLLLQSASVCLVSRQNSGQDAGPAAQPGCGLCGPFGAEHLHDR